MMPETLSQPMAALERANEKRIEVSKLKQRVRSGELPASVVITIAPDILRARTRDCKPVTATDVLSWQFRWGRKRAERFLQQLGIPHHLPLHHLTRERRRKVAQKLG
jgi:hypothetical protein